MPPKKKQKTASEKADDVAAVGEIIAIVVGTGIPVGAVTYAAYRKYASATSNSQRFDALQILRDSGIPFVEDAALVLQSNLPIDEQKEQLRLIRERSEIPAAELDELKIQLNRVNVENDILLGENKSMVIDVANANTTIEDLTNQFNREKEIKEIQQQIELEELQLRHNSDISQLRNNLEIKQFVLESGQQNLQEIEQEFQIMNQESNQQLRILIQDNELLREGLAQLQLHRDQEQEESREELQTLQLENDHIRERLINASLSGEQDRSVLDNELKNSQQRINQMEYKIRETEEKFQLEIQDRNHELQKLSLEHQNLQLSNNILGETYTQLEHRFNELNQSTMEEIKETNLQNELLASKNEQLAHRFNEINRSTMEEIRKTNLQNELLVSKNQEFEEQLKTGNQNNRRISDVLQSKLSILRQENDVLRETVTMKEIEYIMELEGKIRQNKHLQAELDTRKIENNLKRIDEEEKVNTIKVANELASEERPFNNKDTLDTIYEKKLDLELEILDNDIIKQQDPILAKFEDDIYRYAGYGQLSEFLSASGFDTQIANKMGTMYKDRFEFFKEVVPRLVKTFETYPKSDIITTPTVVTLDGMAYSSDHKSFIITRTLNGNVYLFDDDEKKFLKGAEYLFNVRTISNKTTEYTTEEGTVFENPNLITVKGADGVIVTYDVLTNEVNEDVEISSQILVEDDEVKVAIDPNRVNIWSNEHEDYIAGDHLQVSVDDNGEVSVFDTERQRNIDVRIQFKSELRHDVNERVEIEANKQFELNQIKKFGNDVDDEVDYDYNLDNDDDDDDDIGYEIGSKMHNPNGVYMGIWTQKEQNRLLKNGYHPWENDDDDDDNDDDGDDDD